MTSKKTQQDGHSCAIAHEPRPGMQIDLGAGFVFTIEEVLPLQVDWSISAEELADRTVAKENVLSRYSWAGASWLESMPLDVEAVIGRLNRSWSEREVSELLLSAACPLRGSGAWVREAFLAARPCYDNKGWIGFAGDPASRWQWSVRRGYRYYPGLFRNGKGWRRGFHNQLDARRAGDRLCLTWKKNLPID